MPFDANLVLANDDGDWTFANLVTSDYGSPTSTTRNAGGFAVLDLGSANIGTAVHGIAIVLIFLDSANASDDALTCIAEESGVEAFTSDVHELGKFDIAAATKGILLGSEIPATIVMRVTPKERYLRIDASCVAADDFGTVWALVSPYPFRLL
jgi:hypothetical protein